MLISRDNQYVKGAIKLKQKKFREQEGKFLAEGVRFISEAIQEGLTEYILYSEKLLKTRGGEELLKANVPFYEIEDKVLSELCDTENPQGAAAVVRKPEAVIDIKNCSFIVILDGVQDPGNLGTIIRTCDAAGVEGIFLIKGTADIYNDKVLRSTMGSVFHIPTEASADFDEVNRRLLEEGYSVYASSLSESTELYSCSFKGKTAVIIGNEANGVPENHIKAATDRIRIPMPGRAESLNAATAAAVILFEAVRQRR